MATATLERASPPGPGGSRGGGSDVSWAPRLARRGDWTASVVPALVMLAVALIGLDRGSVWRDEAASLVAARRTLPELVAMLHRTEVVHALYYTLLHGWLQLHDSEPWARVPSVLAMAAAAGLVGAIGTRLASPRVGLAAGLVLVANPAASYYAQEIRSSALVAAAALLCAWFALLAVERDRRWWGAYAVAGLVLVALNVLAILVLPALAVTLLWWRVPRTVLLRWAVATVPAGVLGIAVVAVSLRQPFQVGWIPRPGVTSFRTFAQLLLGPSHAQVLAGGVLLVVGLVTARAPAQRRLRALALPLIALPFGVLVLASLAQPIFVPRYVLPSVAGAAWAVALGIDALASVLGRRRRRVVVAVMTAAVLGVAVLGLGTQRLDRTPASRPDDLAGAAAAISERARPGDALLFVPDNRRLLALAYPAAFADLHDLGLAASPVQARNLTGRALPLAAVLSGLDASDRVWVVGRPGLALLPAEQDSAVELGVLERDFVAADRTGADGVGAVLFLRRTPGP